jgi:ubiquinone/menaquinone biosynthesis C-methylase UbiE
MLMELDVDNNSTRGNYFVECETARRYAASRPAFHGGVVATIRAFFEIDESLAIAVDVACGTGQSTLPLLDIAARVIGIDVSTAMLNEAARHERINYVTSRAEQLPLSPESLDLITVALAFHWFDRGAFLAEVQRVLRPGGRLVLYNNAFYGRMVENSEFEHWFRQRYLARYPTPARRGERLTDGQAREYNLQIVGDSEHTNEVRFTSTALASYLSTQSNVIAVIDTGWETLPEAIHWIGNEVASLVPEDGGTFAFGGPVMHLRKGR